jgi:hypothetical protein
VSWDISVDADPCKTCGQKRGIDVGNMTYNVGPAYHAAMGFSLSDLRGVKAAVAIKALEAGEAELRANLDRYRPLVRGEGTWGTIEQAVEYLHRLLDACRAMPDGTVSVG